MINYEDYTIGRLKPHVVEYIHNNKLPPIPKMDGSLFGIGFQYDEDQDDRILMLIENFHVNPWETDSLIHRRIIAIQEHEGTLTLWSHKPINTSTHSIEVGNDIWSIEDNYSLKNGYWVDSRGHQHTFDGENKIGSQPTDWMKAVNAAWPLTIKQYRYLETLGYNGEIPSTRKEASQLIEDLVRNKPPKATKRPVLKVVG